MSLALSPSTHPMLQTADKPVRLLLALAIACTSIGGCAGLPRIDPTGNRLLIFPGEQPQAIPAVAPLPAAPAEIATPPNSVAPPVFTDPLLPGTPGSTTTTDLLGRPTVIGPPVSTVAGAPVAGAAPIASDRLVINPSKLLAPVGSEVVVRAGICNTQGYLLANQRVEWSLGRSSAGQIVEVGHRNRYDIGRFPWNNPRKVDNTYAIGATSPYAQCLDRGTPDPTDDLEIRRGDAWITVSSAAEGTSYVTAYAPDVDDWRGRTAAATIHWVDAQWAFPPSVTIAPGQSHTLTTTITRTSDGSPIAGWIVRYRVEGGSANLGGYDASQTSEIRTNAQGQASVSVAPTDGQSGTTQIAIEIVRPDQPGSNQGHTLATGLSTITWAAGGMNGTPMTTPPFTDLPAENPPLQPTPDDGFRPPAEDPNLEPTPAATPDLRVEIVEKSAGPYRVGDSVEFEITISNNGQGTAQNLRFRDSFSQGLSHRDAAAGVFHVESADPLVLEPGKSFPMPITFDIVAAGQQSHTVNVTADRAVPASASAYIDVIADAPAATIPPNLDAQIVGPPRQDVNSQATYRIAVTNRGTEVARNVVVTFANDPELRARNTLEDERFDFDRDHLARTGEIRWAIPEMQPGERLDFDINCDCQLAGNNVCTRMSVSADGLASPITGQACTEIRAALPGGVSGNPGAGAGNNPSPVVNDQGLPVVIDVGASPRVGVRYVLSFRLTNNSSVERQNVMVRLLIPQNFNADVAHLQSPLPLKSQEARTDGLVLVFGPISMPPGDMQPIAIPVDPVREGNAHIFAERAAEGLDNLVIDKSLEVRPR